MKKNNTKFSKLSDAVNEPFLDYSNTSIKFFNGIDEENEYTLHQYAIISRELRLATVTKMRLFMHPELNTNLNPWRGTIYFD